MIKFKSPSSMIQKSPNLNHYPTKIQNWTNLNKPPNMGSEKNNHSNERNLPSLPNDSGIKKNGMNTFKKSVKMFPK
jgi:hypothetical protein